MAQYCLLCIVRAGWVKPTVGSQKRANAKLVYADQARRHTLHVIAAASKERNSSRAAATSLPDKTRRGRTNKSKPPSSCCWRRKVSRTRRFNRLRSTARLATRLPTTIPRRANPSPLNAACTRKHSLLTVRRDRRRTPNAGPPGKRARRWKASDRKPLTALGAAAVENLAAAQGLHARPEPMGARAANFRRLISAFHLDPEESGEKASY